MLNWLVGEFHVFGLAVQNWMVVIGGGLALYLVALAMLRRREPTR